MQLPARLRHVMDNVAGALNTQLTLHQEMGGLGGGHGLRRPPAVQGYYNTNTVLSAFIDHSLRSQAVIDYVVTEKTLLERVLALELKEPAEKGFFYPDGGHAYDAVLFYGSTVKLLLFDIMLFSLVDLLFQSAVAAACVNYLVTLVMRVCRDAAGRKNIAKKTMIDERFLI